MSNSLDMFPDPAIEHIIRAPGPCGLCGKNPATGFASEWTAATGETWFCHGDDDESPTCYERRNWGEGR